MTRSSFSPDDLKLRAVHRRAVEAAIWGMPLVSVDTMREAGQRDAGAGYNDIIFWSKPADWQFQFTTPNASTYYVFFAFNLKDWPVVLDIPPAIGAGLFGSLVDAWEVPVTDVGPEGDDQGKGGRYVMLPPGFSGEVPQGYFPLRFETNNGYGLLRAIPVTTSQGDIDKAIGLVRQLRLYPLARADAPPEQRHIDMAGKVLDGVVKFDDGYFDRLARMIDEEPVRPRDHVMMGQLGSLGIAKGQSFHADAATRKILGEAAEEAHQGFMQGLRGGEPWWPGSQWRMPEDKGAKTGFGFEDENALYLDQRGMIFFFAFAAPKKLGAATFYLVGATDSTGEALTGERTYRLHVPAGVPARQYWAATVYDLETCCFIPKMPRPGIDSYDKEMQRNEDGSVDLYFGPAAPAGQEANWIPTAPGRAWISLFRFYGPEKPLFEKTWRLADYERQGG